MVTNKIKIIDSALDYYPLEPKELILGRQYDNESDIIEIERPKEEKDSICTMIITDQNGTLIDHIIIENNTYRIKNNVSENKIVKVGFSFARQDGYVKNSAILIGRFLEAQKPDGFVPMQPEQQINIDYLISYGFTDSKYENGEIQFFNMKGNKVVSINIGKLIQEQSDWLEADPTNNSYIKNKPTKTSDFENDGEDGSSPFATENFVKEGDANLNSQIIATNNKLTEKANKSDLNNYYTKEETYTKSEVDSKVTNIYKYKGSVQTYADLPTENNQAGDVWNVIEKYESYPAGTNFAWTPDGTWDALGGTTEFVETLAEAIRDNTTQIVKANHNFEAGGTKSSGGGNSVTIGYNAKGNSYGSGVTIGKDATDSGSSGTVLVGADAKSNSGAWGLGLGYNAIIDNKNTIQLGSGTNSTENSLQIYKDNIYNHSTHTATFQNLQIDGVDEYPTLSGADAPTTTTVGKVKQFYVETTTPALYYCSSITGTGTTEDPYVYNWTQAGGDETLAKQIQDNTTQIVGENNNVLIGGATSSKVVLKSTIIGADATAGDDYATIVGANAHVDEGISQSGTAIGFGASTKGQEAIALGGGSAGFSRYSRAVADYAYQIGSGTNTTPNTLQIRYDNIYNHATHTLTVQNAQVNGNSVYGILQGETDPTEATVGAVSQFYLNTTDKKLWQCVAVTTDESTSTTNYEWKEVGANGEKKLYSHDIYLSYIDQRIKGRYINNRKEAFTSEEDLAAYLVSQGNPVINTYSSSMYYLGETQDIVIGFTASTDSNKIILLAVDITRKYNTITIDNSDIKNASKYNIRYEQKNASTGYLTDTVTEL